MKRWIALATVAATLALATPALAVDIPLTTQSSTGGRNNANRPLLGRGGIFLPWLNKTGSGSRMDSGIGYRGAARHGYGSTPSSLFGLRNNREAGSVLPNLDRSNSRSLRR
jgi:hypothetical protein